MSILIVDDTPTNLVLLSALTEAVSNIAPVTFEDPLAALAWCEGNVPELVLVDYRMPQLTGNEFIERFRQISALQNIPIVMVTTENDREIRGRALQLGATEFLKKPIDASEFRLRIRNLLALRRAQIVLADRAKQLQGDVEKASAAVFQRERELMLRLSMAAEFRDSQTGAHIRRVAHYSALIAKQLGLTEKYQQNIRDAAPMHDIGKLAIPDAILRNPGRLTVDEIIAMRRHAEIGAQILSGSSSRFIRLAEEIAGSHHERFDGSGFPKGQKGNAIPLSGRIVAVADVFDALTSERLHKQAWKMEDGRAYLIEHAGAHFCPKCVSAFVDGWGEVLAIRSRYLDTCSEADTFVARNKRYLESLFRNETTSGSVSASSCKMMSP